MPACSDAAVASSSRCASAETVAHGERRRVVAVVAVDDRPDVHGEHVTLDEDDGARRNPVNDLGVDRRAQRLREAVVALERGNATVLADDRLGEFVELLGGDAGAHGLPHKTESPGADAPGLPHEFDLCC